MKTEASAQNTCVIWIDHPNRIVSFQKAEGFEPQSFASPDERLAYAFEKCASGYRVQQKAAQQTNDPERGEYDE